MNLSIVLTCLWVIVASLLAMIPSKDNLWFRAYVLIAVGIPLVGFVVYQNGPWIGLLVMFAGMSLLRWPVIYLSRWARRVIGLNKEQP